MEEHDEKPEEFDGFISYAPRYGLVFALELGVGEYEFYDTRCRPIRDRPDNLASEIGVNFKVWMDRTGRVIEMEYEGHSELT